MSFIVLTRFSEISAPALERLDTKIKFLSVFFPEGIRN